MTINSDDRVAGPFIGNSVATVFPFAFKIFSTADVLVVRTDTVTGDVVNLSLNTDYTVQMNGNQNTAPGGTVTMAAALATGFTMIITSDLDYLQPTDLTNMGGFYPEVITDALDRQTVYSQQLNIKVDGSLRAPVGESLGEVPSLSERAGKVLAFDSDGKPVAIDLTGGMSGVFSWNGRSGVVSLTRADVEAVIGVSAETQVTNVAAMRALTDAIPSYLSTQGYYTPGDGGAATYWRDASDTTSADNGGSVLVAADGGRWKLQSSAVVNVRQFGTKGDGTTDDYARMQAFATYLCINGKSGYIPAGKYRLTQRVVFDNTATVFGDGWKDVRDMTGPTTRDWAQAKTVGTIIYGDYTSGISDSIFYVTGNNVTIRDMEFEAKQPLPGVGWTSNATPAAIRTYRAPFLEQGGNSVLIENIMLRNFLDGIVMLGTARGIIRGVFGQCFGNGIAVTKCGDVLRIEDVHLNWPFYSSQTDVVNYMDANSQSLVLGRVDNPMINNFFVFGGRAGIKTYVDTTTPDSGRVERLQCSNVGLDNVAVGLDLEDAVTIDLSNFYVYCRNATDSRCIYSHIVLGGGQTPIRMNLVNGDLQGSMAEAMRFEVPGNVQLTNVRIRNYGQSGGTQAGIAVFSGVAAVGSAVVFETTAAGPTTQANGTGSINLSGGGGGGGGSIFASTIQSTGTVVPSGVGIEMNYDPGFSAGFLNSYDHSTNLYKNLNLGGLTIGFKTGSSGANNSQFDANGNLLINYSSSVGSYKLQVNGAAIFAGDVTGITAPGGASDTRFATTAFVAAAVLAGPTGTPDYTATIRSKGTTTPASGTGIEMNYDSGTNAGYLITYDHTLNQYKDTNIAGLNLTFKSGASGSNAGSFDTNGYLLLGYSSSIGSHKLQVNGTATFNGAVFGATASGGTNTTQLATTAFVQSALGSYALKSGTTFTGAVNANATFFSTGTTAPASGTGIEMNYDTGVDAGFLIAFNHTSSIYKNLNIGGATIGFKSGSSGTNAASFDANQCLLIGYSSTQGVSYRLQVNSQIYATNATIATSDQRLKHNVVSLNDGALELVEALRPVAFDFKYDAVHNLSDKRQIGFIAQEVEAVLAGEDYVESVVHTNDDERQLKGVAHEKLIALLVKSTQELAATVRDQAEQIRELQEAMNGK